MPRIRRHAVVLTRNSDDALDLLQATMEKALAKQNQWQKDSNLVAWVFTIQSSIWKNEIRWRSYRQHDDESSLDYLADESIQGQPERTFLLGQVFNEVMSLAADQREPMLLVYVEGFKYAEAAEILQIPQGTLMSRLARARIIISESLNDQKTDTKATVIHSVE